MIGQHELMNLFFLIYTSNMKDAGIPQFHVDCKMQNPNIAKLRMHTNYI